MAVAQPQILLVMENSSGKTVTNYGSVATNASVNASSTESTDFSWNSVTPAPYLGSYWQSLNLGNGSTAMGYIGMTGIAMPTSSNSPLWAACKFRLTAYNTTTGRAFIAGSTAGSDGYAGNASLMVVAPTAGGNFNLQCRIFVSDPPSGFGVLQTFTGMSFGVDYAVVWMVDSATITAVQGKFKLDAGAVQAPAPVNLSGTAWNATGGYIGRGGTWDRYEGIQGRVYYFANGIGTLLSEADMASINSDPSGTITGWPGAAAPAGQPTAKRGRGVPGMRLGGTTFGQGF